MSDPTRSDTTQAPWCCLCGQRHAWGTPCDQSRLDELRVRVEQMNATYGAVGIYHTSNTTFVRMAAAYLPEENQNG